MLGVYALSSRPSHRHLIANALELDNEDIANETSPESIEREVRKLYAALRGAKGSWLSEGRALQDLRIEMPPWGCGAFGGTLGVKSQCMMMAAGLAGLESENLELMVTREREDDMSGVPQGGINVADLFRELTKTI